MQTIISMKWGARYGPEFVNRLNKSIQKEIFQHALGIKTKVMKECIPDHKKQS